MAVGPVADGPPDSGLARCPHHHRPRDPQKVRRPQPCRAVLTPGMLLRIMPGVDHGGRRVRAPSEREKHPGHHAAPGVPAPLAFPLRAGPGHRRLRGQDATRPRDSPSTPSPTACGRGCGPGGEGKACPCGRGRRVPGDGQPPRLAPRRTTCASGLANAVDGKFSGATTVAGHPARRPSACRTRSVASGSCRPPDACALTAWRSCAATADGAPCRPTGRTAARWSSCRPA